MTPNASTTGLSLQLGAHLIRSDITRPILALSRTASTDGSTNWFIADADDTIQATRADDAQDADLSLVIRTLSSPPPTWQRLLSNLGVPTLQHLDERPSSGAILFVRVDGRLVAWTFGTGSRWLSKRALDPRFGLLVALNAVAKAGGDSAGLLATHLIPGEGGLRVADLRVGSPTREPFARFDVTTDRLMGVVAETNHDRLSRVHGSRSARFEGSIATLSDFRTHSERLLELRDETTYKEGFGYVENIVEEDDPDKVTAVLEAVWHWSDPADVKLEVDIAWWDDIRDDNDDRVVTHFRLPRDVRSESVPTDQRPRNLMLTWQGVRARLLNAFPEDPPAALLGKEIRFYSRDDEEIGRCQVRDLIVAEPLINGTQYVLTDGDVFRVDADYLKKLDGFLNGLVLEPCPLPPYPGGDEDTYNRNAGLTLLDQRLITVEGSRLELCDLIDEFGRMIFVKIKKRASVMSHLWAQVVSSAVLLRRSTEARQRASERLQEVGAPDDLIERIEGGAQNLNIVFAILGITNVRQMTLLARVPLRAAVQQLQDLGHSVEIHLVSPSTQ